MAILGAHRRSSGAVSHAVVVVFISAWALTPLSAQRPTFNERDVKAVFLLNFAQFVEWPAEAFAESTSPIVIGILGEDPFGRVLDDVVQGEVVKNRRLTVERFQHVDEVDTCHILFISSSETQRYEQILAALQRRSILTVGDREGFAASGGMIRFVTEQNRIRFRVNVAAIKAARLVVSSRLLRAAEIVGAERMR